MPFVILGVHPIVAIEPCFLIEVKLRETHDYQWTKVTQEVPGSPKDAWQVPWDERPLDVDKCHWAFFFHYLDLNKPLLTPDGPIAIPIPTSVPHHLKHIVYEQP